MVHGGGYTCYGAGRMDQGWKVRPDARVKILQPPGTCLNRFCDDCPTHSEPALRYRINAVGVDSVAPALTGPLT